MGRLQTDNQTAVLGDVGRSPIETQQNTERLTMPRNAHYNNRWQKANSATALYAGTWVTVRTFGHSHVTPTKLDRRLDLISDSHDCSATQGNREYKWTEAARLSAILALDQPCSICNRRARKPSPQHEVITRPNRLNNARRELSHLCTAKDTVDFDAKLKEYDLTIACWECLLRPADLSSVDFAFVSSLPIYVPNQAGLVEIARSLLAPTRESE